MKTLMMSTAAVLIAAAGVAFAAEADIDTNHDGQIDAQEWNASRADSAEVFGKWDTNGDNTLSRDEYAAGVKAQSDADKFGTWDDRYKAWDTDDNGMLSQEEYDTGLWNTFDANHDNMWNADELKAWNEDEMRYDATRAGRDVSQ